MGKSAAECSVSDTALMRDIIAMDRRYASFEEMASILQAPEDKVRRLYYRAKELSYRCAPDESIMILDLSLWVFDALMRNQIYTVEVVRAIVLGEDDRKLRQFGKRTRQERARALAAIGKLTQQQAAFHMPTYAFLDSDVWAACLDYWDSKCAVCGGTDGIVQDHWVSHYSNVFPGSHPTNIVPLCHTCNCSKNDGDPWLFLVKKLGHIGAAKKAGEIAEYILWWEKKTNDGNV